MAGSMMVSLHLTKKTHEMVHIPKFDDQDGLNVRGNMIKKDLRLSEIERGGSKGTSS
jgi:hypothetical protein